MGEVTLPPFKYLEEAVAPDARTLVLRWKQPFAEAGALQGAYQSGFPPLPRHILARPAESMSAAVDAFVAHPFWAQEYVGLGPFRLDRWEPATFLEGSAFEGHALGRPKIDRIKVLFMGDPNTVLANLLSGEAHVNIDDSIRFQQAAILQREWGPRSGGTVLMSPAQTRYTHVQLRPELVSPRALLDLRFRQGLAHAVDRQALLDALLEGQGIAAHTFVVPQVESFADVERAILKYPYDLRRTEQLFSEIGVTRGADGFYTTPGEGRVVIDIRVLSGAANETEAAVMADSFRRTGIDSTVYVFPQAQGQDAVARASFPGLTSSSIINAFEPPIDRLRASEIPSPENRWRGANRGGWSSPDFERAVDAYEMALDRAERNRRVAGLLRVISEELPAYPLFYNPMVTAHVAGLRGPVMSVSARAAGWNVHEWEWQ
jgi:peptide/nickel transport system substrate-binding protein